MNPLELDLLESTKISQNLLEYSRSQKAKCTYLIILILQEHYEGDIKGEDLKTLDNALELDLLESTKISQKLPEYSRSLKAKCI